jgi:hypothetical protein
MSILAGVFILALYKATENVWDKAFDAAWEPVDESLKARFFRWAGKDQASQREAAFAKAADTAYRNTLRQTADPQQAEKILNALNNKLDKRTAGALAEEGAKLMLFSATPDVPRLADLCQRRLNKRPHP